MECRIRELILAKENDPTEMLVHSLQHLNLQPRVAVATWHGCRRLQIARAVRAGFPVVALRVLDCFVLPLSSILRRVHPWHKILLKFPFLRRVFGRVKVSFEQAAERGQVCRRWQIETLAIVDAGASVTSQALPCPAFIRFMCHTCPRHLQDGLLYLPYSKLRVALADLGHGSADGDASAAPGNGGDQLLEGGQTPPSTAAAAAAGHAGHRGSTGGNPAGFVTDAQLRAIFNTSDLYHEQKLTFREFLVALALGYLLGYIGLGNGDDDGAELEDFGVAPYAAAGVAGADNVIADGVDGGTSPGQHKPASSSASSLARANSMSRVSESLRSRADSAQHMAAMLGHAPAGVLNAGGPGRASATSASRYHLLSASQQHMDGPTEGAASQPDAPLPDGHVHGGTTTAAAEHQPQTGSAGGAAPLEASPDAPSHHHGSGHRIVPLGGSAGGGTGAQGLGSSRRLAAAASASGVDGHPNNHGLFRHVSFTDGQALALEGDTASAAAIAREAAQQLHAETVAEESRTTAASSSITARSSFGRYTHGHPASTVDTANGAATTAAMMTAVGSSTPPTSSSDVTPRVTGGDANAEGSGLVHRTLSVGTSGAPKPILKSKSSNSMVLGAGQDDKAAMGAGSNLSSPSVPRAASGTLRFVEPAGVVTSAAGGEAEGSSPGDGSATWATAVAAPPHGSDNQHRHHNHSAGHIRFQGADADADDARGGFDGKQPDASGLPVAHHSSRGSGAYDSVGSDKDLEVTGTARVDVHVHHADGTVVPEAPLAAGGSGSSASTTSAADRLTHLARMRTNDIDRAGASGTGADIAFAFHLVLEAYIQVS